MKLKFETVTFDHNRVVLIDQRQLPGRFVKLKLTTVPQVYHAIQVLAVRGAPAIGIAAGYGVCLAVIRKSFRNRKQFLATLKRAGDYLKESRPTAVNLAWAVERVYRAASNVNCSNVGARHASPLLEQAVLKEARSIHQEDIELCFRIGRYGSRLIKNGDTVLTHCNAGGLATSGYGTALSPLFEAKRLGKRFRVLADETRPLLQGARLTMWELKQYGLDARLICDNMAGTLMRQGAITKVITGADRIVRNGDTANKIGTYAVACLAKVHKIPFYVAAPHSTFDFSLASGDKIPIEERKPHEITDGLIGKIAPAGTRVLNPAFDVTPYHLIAGFITDKGIIPPPFKKNLKKLQ